MLSEELIHRIKGLKIAVFDFDGVMTTNQVFVTQDGQESVECNRSDGLGMRLLLAEKIEPMILSHQVNAVVEMRAKKLSMKCVSNCEDKGSSLRELCQTAGLTLDEIAFVGNDANDLEAIEMVGVGVAVADAYPEVLQVSDWQLKRAGGYGAVREFCEVVCRVRRNLTDNQSPWMQPDLRATYARGSKE